MNKTNWQNWKSWRPKIANYFRNQFKDDLKTLVWTVGSFLYSALIAFCFASAITDAFDPIGNWILIFLASWLLSWIVLRVIRHLTIKHMALFAGVFTKRSLQCCFIFILDGIIYCYVLGKRIAEGGELATPIILILLGVLWAVDFVKDVFRIIERNHTSVQLAASALETLNAHLIGDETRYFSITAESSDGEKKIVHWVRSETDPREGEQSE